MTNMILMVLLMYWAFCNGVMLSETIRDYEEMEKDDMFTALHENVPSRLGKIFYLPVTIYSLIHDLVKKRDLQEEAR